MATKIDPGPYDCYAKLHADEPYFVLRAKDLDGPEVVRDWVKRRLLRAFEQRQELTPEYTAKLEEALRDARAMELWKKQHPEFRSSAEPKLGEAVRSSESTLE